MWGHGDQVAAAGGEGLGAWDAGPLGVVRTHILTSAEPSSNPDAVTYCLCDLVKV